MNANEQLERMARTAKAFQESEARWIGDFICKGYERGLNTTGLQAILKKVGYSRGDITRYAKLFQHVVAIECKLEGRGTNAFEEQAYK